MLECKKKISYMLNKINWNLCRFFLRYDGKNHNLWYNGAEVLTDFRKE